MSKKYLNFEEQCELVKKSLAGDENAFTQLLDFTYPFIVKLATPYLSCGLEFEDLIQEGNIAVYTALSKYRPECKAKFSSYAVFHIRKRLNLYVQSQRRIQLPSLKQVQLSSYLELLEEPDPCPGGSLTDEQMAEILDMNLKQYRLMKNLPISFLGKLSCVEEVKDSQPSTTSMEDQAILNVIVEDAIKELPEMERYILSRYYQLSGFQVNATIEDISKEVGYSKEWVRQKLHAARAKLHDALKDIYDM